MESSTSNFVELEWNELSDKLSDLASQHAEVKIWAKGDAPDLCVVVNSHSEDTEGEFTQQLRLKHPSVEESWQNKDFYIQFPLQSVEYFSKGRVVEILDGDEFWFEMNPHVFRVEKRENERLQTYPNYQAYAYFKVSEDSTGDNVVFLNKHIEENHRIFKKFKQLSEKEILEIQDSTDVDKNDELLGFRVIDLSATGVSFIANEKESSHFVGDGTYEVTILFEKNVYHVSNAKLVYNVDFVNPRAENVSMFKIGLNFDLNKDLSEIVSKTIASEDDGSRVLKEFEDFAD